MDTTFISIHDLSENATILYSSDSVVDILGYTPDDIVDRSAWDFFSIDELSTARDFHRKRVDSDKAAVLAYCRIKNAQGELIGCECCFTIVYDVMIVCTSIYRQGVKSDKRAADAPLVRRIFSSSPKDPRYHMLSHLSTKFSQPSQEQQHEPRAALFLNRFTRTLTIMYATSSLEHVIGIPGETMRGRSFYYCIAQNCLQDAVKCLENAKGNDSIAYLRFWFRDPRVDDEPEQAASPTPSPSPSQSEGNDSDEEMITDASDDGGVHLQSDDTSPGADMDIDSDESKGGSPSVAKSGSETHEALFGPTPPVDSSRSATGSMRARSSPPRQEAEPIELEAVVSCTSDGLVVCLRKARPLIPHPAHRPSRPVHQNGIFAAPWATEPILPPLEARTGAGFGTPFAPALSPQGARSAAPSPGTKSQGQMDFMSAIRDQAVFAWALTGINGSLASFGQGKPCKGAYPADGLPIWASDPKHMDGVNGYGSDRGSNGYNSGNEKYGYGLNGRSNALLFGDPGLDRNGHSGSGSRSTGGSSGGNSSSTTPYEPPPP